MPNNRHNRQHRLRDEDADNNNHGVVLHAPAMIPAAGIVGGQGMEPQNGHNDNAGARLQKCCSPSACRSGGEKIDPDDPYDAVKVICNNETCTEGNWMHKECFQEFEQSVLAYLRSCGRARSWSEKQRLQNLWTKKGYDLAFKACDCRCGRGHLRKDLDYIQPVINDNAKKQKRHKKKNDKPMPVVSTTHKSNSHSQNIANHATTNGNHNPSSIGIHATHGHDNKKVTQTVPSRKTDNHNDLRNHHMPLDNRTSVTTSSTNADALNSNVKGSEHILFNSHMPSPPRDRTNSVSSTCSVGSHSSSIGSGSAGSSSPISASPISGDMFFKERKSSDASSDGSTCGMLVGGFRQRQDLSAFAHLPRYKQNPYHIHMDQKAVVTALKACSLAPTREGEDTDVGDTDTRNFVLGNLLSKRINSMRCVLCKDRLPVFDRFPLIDGTFFLSPQSYDEACIQVIWEGRLQFMNAVCLSCMEGVTDVKCVACKRSWDGSPLVVGSMYTYDIFAAMPCCQKRLTCKCCRRAVIDVTRGLNFYSQYSQMIICPYCHANDYHFIRCLADTFVVSRRSQSSGSISCD